MHLVRRLLAVALLINVHTLFAAKPPIDVYILAGQSNMVGSGDRNELPASLEGPSPQQIIVGGTVHSDGWQFVHPGLGTNEHAFGPEIGFAATLPGKSALIKFAASGTSLATDWRPGSTLYAAFIIFVRDALRQLNTDHTVNLRALVWVHGETDAFLGGTAATDYLSNLSSFTAKVRADLSPTLRLVLSDINQVHLGAGMPIVRMAQHLAVDVIPNTCLVNTAAMGTTDGLHYGTADYVDLGSRLAEAAVADLPIATPLTAAVLNQSVRGILHPEDGPLIAGFVIGGDHPVKVLIRGVSHTLEKFGVKDVLPDPALKLFNLRGELLLANDSAPAYLQTVFARIGATPLESKTEAALLVELPPGVYSAHLRDVANAGGAALMELYLVGQ